MAVVAFGRVGVALPDPAALAALLVPLTESACAPGSRLTVRPLGGESLLTASQAGRVGAGPYVRTSLPVGGFGGCAWGEAAPKGGFIGG